jgi:RNA methyltransferase, TrmH family
MPSKKHKSRPAKQTADGERKELKYYGAAACLALWRQRPNDLIRIYIEERCIPEFSAMLQWAAAKHRAYHIVSAEDLERLTQSIHHQGVCILAKEHIALAFHEWLPLVRDEIKPQLLVYLDGVENPHNLGAIIRTCAHFGVRYVLGMEDRLPKLSPAACRVAEGGAEEVMLVYLQRPIRQLRELQNGGFELIATAAHEGTILFEHRFRPRCILMLGHEGEGINPALFQAADKLLRIPGSGRIESLNVSVAFGVIAGEYYRQASRSSHSKTTSLYRRNNRH